MTEDILQKARQANPTMNLVYSDIMYNQALIFIEDKVMSMVGKTMRQLQIGLPEPTRRNGDMLNRKMSRETNYNPEQLKSHVVATVPHLSQDQGIAYQKIVDLVQQEEGGIIFLDAPGGTGKTFLINLLLAKI
jgi:hypothetical protein